MRVARKASGRTFWMVETQEQWTKSRKNSPTVSASEFTTFFDIFSTVRKELIIRFSASYHISFKFGLANHRPVMWW
jgi:hypothetical protein